MQSRKLSLRNAVANKRLGSILDSSIDVEDGRDFDYYFQKSMNESSLAAAPVTTSVNDEKKATTSTSAATGGRVKRVSAVKALANIQDVDFEEEEQTRRKYDRLVAKKG